MKRGIDVLDDNELPAKKECKSLTFLRQLPSFTSGHLRVPQTAFRNILSNLPAYRFIGSHPLHAVCKTWNQELTTQVKPNTTHQAIMDSCKNPFDALYVLSDEEILPQFSLKEILAIAGLHEGLAKQIINTPELRYLLKESDIPYLGKKNPVIAQYMLEELDPHTNEPFKFVGIFASNHFNVAQRCLHTPALYSRLDDHNKVQLASKHLTLAQDMLDSPAQINDLNGHELAILGSKYPIIANQILDNPHLCSKLESCDLAKIASKHYDIAERVFQSHELFHRLNSTDVVKIASHHIIIATRFLDDPAILIRLSGYDLAILGSKHFIIARRILQTPQLRDKLNNYNLADLASENFKAALFILHQSPDLCNKLERSQIAAIGKAKLNIGLALYIMKNWSLWNKLYSWDQEEVSVKANLALAIHRLAKTLLMNEHNLDLSPKRRAWCSIL